MKVFVDLATIAAGEGDIEVAKVKCLQSATAGYGPLIFIMTRPCNYDVFLKKCEQVWDECQTDKALPRKLVKTKLNLEIKYLTLFIKFPGSFIETISHCNVSLSAKYILSNTE